MAMNVPFALESEHVRAVNYSPSASLLQHSLVLLCHFIDFSYKQILDFNSIQSSSFVRLRFPFSSCPTNNSKLQIRTTMMEWKWDTEQFQTAVLFPVREFMQRHPTWSVGVAGLAISWIVLLWIGLFRQWHKNT